MFDGRWLEVSAHDYLQQIDEEGSICILFVLPIDLPIAVIGMPALIDYYSSFDPISGLVSIAPHTSSGKSDIITGPVPPKEQQIEISLSAEGNFAEGHDLIKIISWSFTGLLIAITVGSWIELTWWYAYDWHEYDY